MMSITLALNSQDVDGTYQDVYEWLRDQAKVFGLQATLLVDEATLRSGWLYLPVHIEGVTDAYDNALKLQKLEDTWNDRSPQPEPPLFLVSAKDPLRRAAWERVAIATQRKMRAVDAFSVAKNLEEQELAAAEFQKAKQAEEEVSQAYEQIMPWNERTA